MRVDLSLTRHFWLSQFTVCPDAARAGLRNEPLAHQVENLRRVAQLLELVRNSLGGIEIHVLGAFRRPAAQFGATDAACEGRAADFIAPDFGTPRQVCAQLVQLGILSDRLVCCPGWVHVEVPPEGSSEPRRQIQTGVFEHGQPMRLLEGLV